MVSGQRFCCRACEFLSQFEEGLSLKSQKSSTAWDYLDSSPFIDHIRTTSQNQSLHNYRLFLKGLNCSSCTHLLEKLPQIDERILNSQLSFLDGELKLTVSSDLTPSEIARQIEHLGYEPKFLTESEQAKDLLSQESKSLVKKIAVAGFSLGNIMLLSIAKYSGLEGSLKYLFSITEMILFLPILLYAGIPFYKGALLGLKQRSIHLDMVISFSLISSFVFSVIGFLVWGSEMYLDSLAAFTFLILIGRWMIKKAESHSKDQLSDGLFSPDQPVRILEDQIEKTIRLKDLTPGQTLLLGPDQILPCDGQLLSSRAYMDTSFVSGESEPKHYQQGQALFAGMKSLRKDLKISVQVKPEDTDLHQALMESEQLSLSKSRQLKKLNQIGKSILYAALALGALTFPIFLFLLQLGFQESWSRLLSLLVVTCPCALAFGGPLTYSLALRESKKRGLIVSSADVFDRMSEIKNVIFDKTGTLTTGHLKLIRSEPEKLPIWHRAVILGLERSSFHPVAFALREAYGDQVKQIAEVRDVNEVLGEKVFGLFDNEIYSLRRAHLGSGELNEVGFFKGDELLAKLYFEDEIRPETPSVLSKLKSKYELSISSGDKASRVLSLGKALGISPENLFGDQSPRDKLQYVKSHPHAVMLGDGFNDAAALGAADVGIAVAGPLQQSLKNADVCFLKSGLNPLLDLMDISTRLNTSLKRNYNFTIAYNLIAGSLALLGIVTPLIAAIIMPLSSLFVLTQAKRGFL